jgi:hypothetical protein
VGTLHSDNQFIDLLAPFVLKSEPSKSRSIIMLQKNKRKKTFSRKSMFTFRSRYIVRRCGSGHEATEIPRPLSWFECGEMFDVRCTLHSISDRGNCFRTNKAKGKCKFSNIQSDVFVSSIFVTLLPCLRLVLLSITPHSILQRHWLVLVVMNFSIIYSYLNISLVFSSPSPPILLFIFFGSRSLHIPTPIRFTEILKNEM